MRDLISRQAAIDRINKQREHLQPDVYPQDEIGDAAYRICSEFIERLPSAERTGRWTHVYDENEKLFFRNKWVCSACGKSNTYGMPDFCPCCGARMENSMRRTMEAENKSV